jgi:hypothetical protein
MLFTKFLSYSQVASCACKKKLQDGAQAELPQQMDDLDKRRLNGTPLASLAPLL